MNPFTLGRITRHLEKSGWKKAEIYVFLRQFIIRRLPQNTARPSSLAALLASPVRTPPDAIQKELSALSVAPAGSPDGITPHSISLVHELLSANEKEHGVFYTPWPIAQKTACAALSAVLVRQAKLPPATAENLLKETPVSLSKKDAHLTELMLSRLHVCDPAAGTGGLLIPFALELARLRKKLTPSLDLGETLVSIFKNNLYAGDISASALEDLQIQAALVCMQYGSNNLPHTILPHTLLGDSLACIEGKNIWQERYPAVFRQNGGFDIILSNPPYLGQKNHREVFERLRENPLWKPHFKPKSDLLYFFFYLALTLLKEGGIGSFLTTSYFASAAGAVHLRQELQAQAAFLLLEDFADQRLFKRAAGQHSLLSVFEKNTSPQKPACQIGAVSVLQKDLYHGKDCFLQTTAQQAPLEKALAKMAACPRTLQDCALVTNGLMTGCDHISAAHLRRFKLPGIPPGTGVFVLSQSEKEALSLTQQELQKLKPFFKNSDISAYTAAQTPRHWLIDFFYPNDRNLDTSLYPHLLAHLARFAPVLLARKQNNNGIDKLLARGIYWFGSVRRKMDFEADKIVIPQRAPANRFAFAPGPWYASSDVYFISRPTGDVSLWYLLGLFNSAPYEAWLFCRGKRKGKLLELYSAPLKTLPVPAAPKALAQKLEETARKIYLLKKSNPAANTDALQKTADQTVEAIFAFSAQECLALAEWKKNR